MPNFPKDPFLDPLASGSTSKAVKLVQSQIHGPPRRFLFTLCKYDHKQVYNVSRIQVGHHSLHRTRLVYETPTTVLGPVPPRTIFGIQPSFYLSPKITTMIIEYFMVRRKQLDTHALLHCHTSTLGRDIN